MKSVDINWTLLEEYPIDGYKVRIYQGEDEFGITYRYEIEDLEGLVTDPLEPYPYSFLDSCKEDAAFDVMGMQDQDTPCN